MRRHHTMGALALGAVLSLAGCEKAEQTPPAAGTPEQPATPAQPTTPAAPEAAAPTAPGDAAAQAKDIFNTRCVTCHGADGKGSGPAAAALNPKPRDWTNAKWQKSVTDDHIAKVIVEGGQAVGLSPLMAANPDLQGKDAVVADLVKMVRSYAAK